MKQRFSFALCLACLATSAVADTDQSVLAGQIEATSRTAPATGADATWTLYPPISFRREMQVDGCDITARSIKLGQATPRNSVDFEITFDLARTQVPDPSAPVGDDFAYLPGKANRPGGTALIKLSFPPPYAPLMRSNISDTMIEEPVTLISFLMEPVAEEAHPRRLLALLSQYKSLYCTHQS